MVGSLVALFVLPLLAACPGQIVGADGAGSEGRPPGAPGGADEPPLLDPPSVEACAGLPPDPGPSFVRRLTREELGRTIELTLGVDARALVSTLPPETRAEGFTNNAGTLIVSEELAVGLMDLAAEVAARLPDLDGLIDEHTDCRRLEPNCTEPFIRGAATRLFRQEPAQEQVDAYATIFETVAADGDGFAAGARLVVEAMLQSPWFLYRVEPRPVTEEPSRRPVDDRVLATRLAFLAWGAAPDPALLAMAETGALRDPDGREAEVRRLIGTPRARAHFRRFMTDWFDLDALDRVNLSHPSYEAFGPELAAEMREETLRFVEHVVFEADRPLIEMYTEPSTFLTDGLAEIYGVEAPAGDGFERVSLADLPERAGILTRPAVLAAHAFGDEPSLVSRGLFVLHDVLCDSVDPPPDGIDTSPPPTTLGSSHRSQSEDRSSVNACGGCHRVFDPLGYPFDVFDAVGRYRVEDLHGNPVRDDGVLLTGDGAERLYQDVAAFVALIEESPRARQCIARKALQFHLGRPLVGADACTVSEVEADFVDRGGRYVDLLVAIARHPTFALIRSMTPEEATP